MSSSLLLEYVELSKKQCSLVDYGDKKKVLDHNKAQKALLRVQREIIANEPESMMLLLRHPDERVRLNASSGCVEASIFIIEAKSVLQSLVVQSKNPSVRLSSRILLSRIDRSS